MITIVVSLSILFIERDYKLCLINIYISLCNVMDAYIYCQTIRVSEWCSPVREFLCCGSFLLAVNPEIGITQLCCCCESFGPER